MTIPRLNEVFYPEYSLLRAYFIMLYGKKYMFTGNYEYKETDSKHLL